MSWRTGKNQLLPSSGHYHIRMIKTETLGHFQSCNCVHFNHLGLICGSRSTSNSGVLRCVRQLAIYCLVIPVHVPKSHIAPTNMLLCGVHTVVIMFWCLLCLIAMCAVYSEAIIFRLKEMEAVWIKIPKIMHWSVCIDTCVCVCVCVCVCTCEFLLNKILLLYIIQTPDSAKT